MDFEKLANGEGKKVRKKGDKYHSLLLENENLNWLMRTQDM